MRWQRGPGAAVFVVLLAACTGAFPVPSGLYFPTFPAGGAQPTAMLEGVLRREGACFVIEAGDQSALALWSSDYHAVELRDGRVAIADAQGNVLAREDEMVSMGGGEYGREHLDFVEDLVGDIPTDCVYELYDIVANISSDE